LGLGSECSVEPGKRFGMEEIDEDSDDEASDLGMSCPPEVGNTDFIDEEVRRRIYAEI
jgi:hypothetical protein